MIIIIRSYFLAMVDSNPTKKKKKTLKRKPCKSMQNHAKHKTTSPCSLMGENDFLHPVPTL
jgi:hypothetical protein